MGLYGASARLVIFVATPFVVFSGVIPPIIAELHAQRKMRQLERALRAGATLAGLPAFGVLLVFLLFGPWVLGTIFPEPYRAGAPILAMLSLGRLVRDLGRIGRRHAHDDRLPEGDDEAHPRSAAMLSVSLGLGSRTA